MEWANSMKRHLAALWLLAGIALSMVSLAASAQVVLVPQPTPRYEVVPAPRQGWAWRPGYWIWTRGVYVWQPGIWVPVVQPGYRVVAPPPPPPRVERLSADALFPFDRGSVGDIRPRGLVDIAQIAAHLRAQPFGHVDVRGYTDRLGNDTYNIDLSQRRADAVKAVLIQQGVPAAKIHAEGLGSQDPIVQCADANRDALIRCLQPNRRVELVTYLRN
jgi:OOP family OmpA-OmpF porin